MVEENVRLFFYLKCITAEEQDDETTTQSPSDEHLFSSDEIGTSARTYLLKHGTTQNHPKPPTKPAKTTYKTNQNDPKPATIYPNTTGLSDICVDGRLRCCVTITLTIMHGIFSPLSRSSY